MVTLLMANKAFWLAMQCLAPGQAAGEVIRTGVVTDWIIEYGVHPAIWICTETGCLVQCMPFAFLKIPSCSAFGLC